jgi:transposase-like protein
VCGSENLQKRGFHRTNVSNFQRYQCQDCSRYSRSRKSESTKLSNTPL